MRSTRNSCSAWRLKRRRPLLPWGTPAAEARPGQALVAERMSVAGRCDERERKAMRIECRQRRILNNIWCRQAPKPSAEHVEGVHSVCSAVSLVTRTATDVREGSDLKRKAGVIIELGLVQHQMCSGAHPCSFNHPDIYIIFCFPEIESQTSRNAWSYQTCWHSKLF